MSCRVPILPKQGQKLADARKKKYCSQKCNASCATEARRAHRAALPFLGADAKKASRKFVPCAGCGSNSNVPGKSNSRKYCSDCWAAERSAILFVKKSESTHSKIRSHARTVANVKANNCCLYCGYDTYVEVCHVKAVKSFPADATLGEINDPANLIVLCRTHHWEFDHGILFYDRVKNILTPEPHLD